jgi:hypothetical protein
LEAKTKFLLVLQNFPFPAILVLTSQKNLLQNLFLKTKLAQMFDLISRVPYIAYDRTQHKATQQPFKSLGLPIPNPQLQHIIQHNRGIINLASQHTKVPKSVTKTALKEQMLHAFNLIARKTTFNLFLYPHLTIRAPVMSLSWTASHTMKACFGMA